MFNALQIFLISSSLPRFLLVNLFRFPLVASLLAENMRSTEAGTTKISQAIGAKTKIIELSNPVIQWIHPSFFNNCVGMQMFI